MTVKVYKYGLLPPTAGAEVIAQQCDLAWRSAVARLRVYEAYRDRREALYQQQSELLARVAELRQRLAEARASLRRLRTGRRAPDSGEAALLKAQICAAAESLRAAREDAKGERQRVREAGGLAALDRDLKADYLSLARAFAAAGLFWGQRQLVEAAHDQRVKARDRLQVPQQWGAVGLQLQGGLPVDRLASDPRVSISPDATPIPGRHGQPRQRLRMRIAPGNGVAEWPIIMHRPLPAGAVLRFAKVVCESVGRRVVWTAHLTLAMPDVETRTDGEAVAIRPTFARRTDGWLIVSEGHDAAGPLIPFALHPRIEGALAKVADLRSIRDKERDQVLAAIEAWRQAVQPEGWPATIARWESCDRLRRFVRQWWAAHRVAGDEAIFAQAWAWSTQDLHLWDWERHAARKALGRRLHDYRVWAAGLAAQYAELVIPATDYRVVAKRKSTPERAETELTAAASRQRTLASPGLLRRVLVEAFRGRGGRVVELPAASSALVLWRERSSGVEKVRAARKAKFASRHRVTGTDAIKGDADQRAAG